MFEPETKEATGAEGIGIVVGGVMAAICILLAISDAPVILEAVKGPTLKKNKKKMNIHRCGRLYRPDNMK